MTEPSKRDKEMAAQFARDHYFDCELTQQGVRDLAQALATARAEERAEFDIAIRAGLELLDIPLQEDCWPLVDYLRTWIEARAKEEAT